MTIRQRELAIAFAAILAAMLIGITIGSAVTDTTTEVELEWPTTTDTTKCEMDDGDAFNQPPFTIDWREC